MMLRYYVLLLLGCYALIAVATMYEANEVQAIFCKDSKEITTFIGLESEKEEFKHLSLGKCEIIPMTKGELRKYKRRFYEGRK
jgi:hypothetical protein